MMTGIYRNDGCPSLFVVFCGGLMVIVQRWNYICIAIGLYLYNDRLYLYSDWFVFVHLLSVFVQRLISICTETNLYYALRLF